MLVTKFVGIGHRLYLAPSRVLISKETGTDLRGRYYSSIKDEWTTVCGSPKRSPFGNERRISKSEHGVKSIITSEIATVPVTPTITQNVSLHTTKEEPPKVKEKSKIVTEEPIIRRVVEEEPKPVESQVASEAVPVKPNEYLPSNNSFVKACKKGLRVIPLVPYRKIFIYDYLDRASFNLLSNEEKEKHIKDLKQERNVFLGITYVVVVLFIGGIYILYLAMPSKEESENRLKSWVLNIWPTITSFYTKIVEPSRDILLPPHLPAPYHQPKYTLVIELKDVLVQNKYDWRHGYRYLKRPGLDHFLDVVGYPNFEVVIYSNESPTQDTMLFPGLDPNQRIMYRMYRDCTKWDGKRHLKVLEKLNRDLSKVIFIDTEPTATEPANQLLIPKWDGNMNDTTLTDLGLLLATIHVSDVDDVRPTIEYYNKQDVDPITAFHAKAIELAEQEKARKASQPQRQTWASKFGFSGFRKNLG